ncbi:hypothetical protein [Azospirillum sp. SYSU D00513]|uniref:hypothetical protein n=1 Tax=Azospirillum sp. SYSU D00513 TaxID=2812561 RepID=UPI001A970B99|nr:hypothetical protein [Azospirillum sp. SYSU D00513]
MQDVYGHDVYGIPSPPSRRAGGGPDSEARLRVPAYVAPGLAAVMSAALLLHLLVATASQIRGDDPAGMMSALFGMGFVLLVLLPFTVGLAARARLAWTEAGG